MKKQIVKMNVNGNIYTVINDTENKYNPLSVYKAWREYRDGTYPLDHRKLLDRYADLTSCVSRIMSDIHNKEMMIVDADSYEMTLEKPYLYECGR